MEILYGLRPSIVNEVLQEETGEIIINGEAVNNIGYAGTAVFLRSKIQVMQNLK